MALRALLLLLLVSIPFTCAGRGAIFSTGRPLWVSIAPPSFESWTDDFTDADAANYDGTDGVDVNFVWDAAEDHADMNANDGEGRLIPETGVFAGVTTDHCVQYQVVADDAIGGSLWFGAALHVDTISASAITGDYVFASIDWDGNGAASAACVTNAYNGMTWQGQCAGTVNCLGASTVPTEGNYYGFCVSTAAPSVVTYYDCGGTPCGGSLTSSPDRDTWPTAVATHNVEGGGGTCDDAALDTGSLAGAAYWSPGADMAVSLDNLGIVER